MLFSIIVPRQGQAIQKQKRVKKMQKQKQQRIEQILEGNFDYENGSLDFSCAKIELSIRKGEVYEGSFHVYAQEGVFVNGSVFSSDWRMECLTGEFSGSDGEISFRFHGENLEERDVVKGTFDIVSNQGEYYLPFVISVAHTAPESSIGSIRNLFHFANLAKSSWKEAVQLYYTPEFEQILSGNDAGYREDYRALSVYGGSEQHVEEFLIQANKKQRIEFLTEQNSLRVEMEGSGAVLKQELNILRNGWGFTMLKVECRGDFFYTEREILTEEDFQDNRCSLQVLFDGNACHGGQNMGELRLYNAYTELRVPVTVRYGRGHFYGRPDADRKRCIVRLMKAYQDFRLRKIGTGAWLKETGRLVEQLVAMDENDIGFRLFQAQLLITEERYQEANWLLDHVSELFENGQTDDTLLAYYLYLTTLIHGDEEYVDKVAEDVGHIFRRDDANWRVAWLLLYLSRDYRGSDRDRWGLLERLYARGCTSPVLYIEALSMINGNPALLRKLGSFERQVLSYGSRQGALKREAVDQMLYLASKVKEYSELLFQTMGRLYGKKKDVQLLQEICTLLVKGGKAGKEYLGWYRAGVENQLRIANLYEHFFLSLDPDEAEELPKSVLKYFSYQNNLDYVRSACLYDYIWQHKEKYGDLYEAYRLRIEAFVREQIGKGRIDRHLANLYQGVLRQDMVDGPGCWQLSRLLFAHLIRVEDERLRKVYVYQPGNIYPAEYTLTEKQTWIALYGSSYTIVFEDAAGSRFVKSVEYTMEKLMIPGKFLRWLLPFEQVEPGLELYLCDNENVCREEPAGLARRELRVLMSDYADASVKKDVYMRLLQFYYEADEMEALDRHLEAVPAEVLDSAEKDTVLKYMVLRGNYELAGQWIRAFGPYFADAKILVRLLRVLLEESGMAEDALMTASAMYAFQRGKYDDMVLEYLSMYYQGMTRNMRDIWKASMAFGRDCYDLSERILVQMLYSGAFVGERMEIFLYYISQGAKVEVEEAFLAQCSYDCFVRERVMEKEVFREIRYMESRGEPVQKVCKLAFLKYFSENRGEMDDETARTAVKLLGEMISEGIYLEFFRKFTECTSLQQELADKTIIEYRTAPGARACIHYTLLGENGETDGYRSEYMREAYGGVFFKDFILFFGESLQYYITEEKDGKTQVTESGTIQKGDGAGGQEDSRYSLLNDIVMARSLQDCNTMDNLLEEYYKRDFLNSRLFALK